MQGSFLMLQSRRLLVQLTHGCWSLGIYGGEIKKNIACVKAMWFCFMLLNTFSGFWFFATASSTHYNILSFLQLSCGMQQIPTQINDLQFALRFGWDNPSPDSVNERTCPLTALIQKANYMKWLACSGARYAEEIMAANASSKALRDERGEEESVTYLLIERFKREQPSQNRM